MKTKTESASWRKDKQFFWLRSKNQTYIILVVFGLVILFLSLFFIFPYIQEIKKNSENLASGKNNLSFLGDQVSEVEKFRNNYQSYKPNLEKVDQLYVDSKNPAGLFEFLEKTASASQIKSEISLLADSSVEKKGNYINFQISSQGEFLKTLKFLEKLETGPYLIEIQNLSIRSSGQDSASKKFFAKLIDANFLIRAYIK